MTQQPFLLFHTTGISGQTAILANHAVTRNDDTDGVVCNRATHRLGNLTRLSLRFPLF